MVGEDNDKAEEVGEEEEDEGEQWLSFISLFIHVPPTKQCSGTLSRAPGIKCTLVSLLPMVNISHFKGKPYYTLSMSTIQ